MDAGERARTAPEVYRMSTGASLYAHCYGDRGALTLIGRDKVQCHLCGRAFKALGHHVLRTHEITPDDYRREFGIGRGVGLTSEALHERFAVVHGPRLAIHGPSGSATASERRTARAERTRACVVCAATFQTRACDKTKTCSANCWRELIGRRHRGATRSDQVKAIIRAACAKRDPGMYTRIGAMNRKNPNTYMSRAQRLVASPISLREIHHALGLASFKHTSAVLSGLVRQGRIRRIGRGIYAPTADIQETTR